MRIGSIQAQLKIDLYLIIIYLSMGSGDGDSCYTYYIVSSSRSTHNTHCLEYIWKHGLSGHKSYSQLHIVCLFVCFDIQIRTSKYFFQTILLGFFVPTRRFLSISLVVARCSCGATPTGISQCRSLEQIQSSALSHISMYACISM